MGRGAGALKVIARYGSSRTTEVATACDAVITAGASCTNATLPSARLASGFTMRDGVEVMIDSSSAGVRFGRSASRRAAMPEMIGAANDVPERRFGFVPR